MPSSTGPHVLLINPISGAGSGLKAGDQLEKALRMMGCDYELLPQGMGEQFVSQYPGNQPVQLFVVGGDGTLRGAAADMRGQNLEIVLIPAGRGNDFARMIGLPVGAVSSEEIWRLALTARDPDAARLTCDVAEVNGKIFLNGCGIGFEGRVVEYMGSQGRSYFRASLRAALSWKEFEVEAELPGEKISSRLMNLSVMNGRMAGGGFQIAPKAKLDDGLLDFIAVGGLHAWEKFIYLSLARRGAHLKLKGVTFRQVSEVSLRTSRPLPWHIDGELQEPAQEFHLKLRPEKMIFRLPRVR